MDQLNNREVAVAAWLCIALLGILRFASTREALVHLLGVLLHRKIQLAFWCLVAYTIGVVWLAAEVGLWTPLLLKDTVLWFVFAGVLFVFRYATAGGEGPGLRKLLGEMMGLTLVVEFLANAYTFSLPVELAAVPFMAMVGGLSAVAVREERYRSVARLMDATAVGFGLLVLFHSSRELYRSLDAVGDVVSLRALILPAVLSLPFIPFAFAFSLLVAYEELFIRLEFGPPKSASLKRWVKYRLIRHVRGSPKRAQDVLRRHALELIQLRSRRDLENVLLQERLEQVRAQREGS